MSRYEGLLFIGDPHLASRAPGFRKDDYPHRILQKLEWSLDYASEHRLLPCILGDVFDKPRANENWLIGELCAMLVGREVIAIYGNHDCKEDTLGDDDSLSILSKARLIRLIDERSPWRGEIGGREVVIGGTPYGTHTPQVTDIFWDGVSQKALVFWMMHHDLMIPNYIGGRIDLFEMPGIHVVVNGHIHTRTEPIRKGKTIWLNPGNIARIKRSSREHVPAILRVDLEPSGDLPIRTSYIEVPHESFDLVFHEEVKVEAVESKESAFVQGLAELQARRTATGEGLQHFLEMNLHRFEDEVAAEIRRLSKEVIEIG
jgi:predicted phosphodiesterase